MPEFAKPTEFSFEPKLEPELEALRRHGETRGVPTAHQDRLLLATWNLANFEVQDREPVHLDLIAEIIGWFDLVALQEIRDDLSGLRALGERLRGNWAMLFSESSGNDERQAFVFDAQKARLGEKVGKLTVPPARLEDAGGEGFKGFDRTPYLASFQAGRLTLLLANVHSFFGSDKKTSGRAAEPGPSHGGAISAPRTRTPTPATSSRSATSTSPAPRRAIQSTASSLAGVCASPTTRRRSASTTSYRDGRPGGGGRDLGPSAPPCWVAPHGSTTTHCSRRSRS